jgi:hypothetical protein
MNFFGLSLNCLFFQAYTIRTLDFAYDCYEQYSEFGLLFFSYRGYAICVQHCMRWVM